MRLLVPLTILAAIGAAALFLLAPQGPRWERLAAPRPEAAPYLPPAPPLNPPAALPPPAEPVAHYQGGVWHHPIHTWHREYRGYDEQRHYRRDDNLGPMQVEPGPVPQAQPDAHIWVDGYGRRHAETRARRPGSELDSAERRAPYHGYREN